MSTEHSSRVEEAKVYFSREQYEYLNKMYPEFVGTPSTPEEVYRFNAGARAVVYTVKARVR